MEPENSISTEVKEDSGRIVFAPDVIATIAGLAAADVKGVASMSAGVVEGIVQMLGRKNLSKGVKVEVGAEEAAIDISIIIEYGYRIKDVCTKIQKDVKNAVETMTGLRVVEVNVYVQGIVFEKPEKPAKELKEPKENIEEQNPANAPRVR